MPSATVAQSGEGLSWVTFERGHRHDASQGERSGFGHEVGQRPGFLGCDSPATSAAVQSHLQKDIEVATVAFGSPVQRGDDLGPVDGLDDVGVGRDMRDLVGLELPDEVDGEFVTASQVRDLGAGLLVLVLTDVPDSEIGKQVDVTRREELRHDHEVVCRRHRGQRPLRRHRCVRGPWRGWPPAPHDETSRGGSAR